MKLNKTINIIIQQIINDFKVGDIPYSFNCDYMTCDYNCIPNKNINNEDINEYTFNASTINNNLYMLMIYNTLCNLSEKLKNKKITYVKTEYK